MVGDATALDLLRLAKIYFKSGVLANGTKENLENVTLKILFTVFASPFGKFNFCHLK